MPADREPGNKQLTEVDKVIHEPARYNVMALLYVVDRAEFLFVQNQTGLTPGNLSSPPVRLLPITLPWRFAVEPRGIQTFLPVTR